MDQLISRFVYKAAIRVEFCADGSTFGAGNPTPDIHVCLPGEQGRGHLRNKFTLSQTEGGDSSQRSVASHSCPLPQFNIDPLASLTAARLISSASASSGQG